MGVDQRFSGNQSLGFWMQVPADADVEEQPGNHLGVALLNFSQYDINLISYKCGSCTFFRFLMLYPIQYNL
ncbi:hypothetical protein [Desulfobacter latus]|uniref:Uncharacterized protein n=1 Tax=Desulfobacter latus TaxID=2292 RepID=A0A850SRP3_9BACT|nr:hypothetical protein [Desulfobacter latus]NWH03809.1 hypothetical protein [Desulfobacter latus]